MSLSRFSARGVAGAAIGSETVTLPAFLNSNVTGTVLPKGRSPVRPVITRLIVPTTSGTDSSGVGVAVGVADEPDGVPELDEPGVPELEDGLSELAGEDGSV